MPSMTASQPCVKRAAPRALPDTSTPSWRIDPLDAPALFNRVGTVPTLRLNTQACGNRLNHVHLVEALWLERHRAGLRALRDFHEGVSANVDRFALAVAYADDLGLPLPYVQGLLDGWGDWEPPHQFPTSEDAHDRALMMGGVRDGSRAWWLCVRGGMVWLQIQHGIRTGVWRRFLAPQWPAARASG